jgi:hypothetical protein
MAPEWRVSRRIFVSQREEVTGDLRKISQSETPFFLNNVVI